MWSESFQARVQQWGLACFTPKYVRDKVERSWRFAEEAIELTQACRNMSRSDWHKLVDYVYDRKIGRKKQEIGGVALSLAMLCNSHRVDMEVCAEDELQRCWDKIDVIRAKVAAKMEMNPNSVLPMAWEDGRTIVLERLRFHLMDDLAQARVMSSGPNSHLTDAIAEIDKVIVKYS